MVHRSSDINFPAVMSGEIELVIKVRDVMLRDVNFPVRGTFCCAKLLERQVEMGHY